MSREITLIRLRKEPSGELNQQLQWLAKSLGLFGDRDKDKSCFRVFVCLLKHQEKPLSSDQLASLTNLTRGTVVHHLHRLEDAGLVISSRKGYLLRESSIRAVVCQIRRDIVALFRNIEETARRIDQHLKRQAL